MGRGGNSRDCKRRVRTKDKGSSDEYDEDYTVGVDETFEDSEGYCSSLAGDESDEEEPVLKKVDRSNGKKGFLEMNKNKVGGKLHKSRFSWKEEKDVAYKNDDDYVDNHNNNEDDHNDDDEDDEYKNEDEEEDDDDEEFTPGEMDLDFEDELELHDKKSVVKGRKRKRNSDINKKSLKRKPTRSRGLKRKTVDGDCRKKKPVVKGKTGKSSTSKRRRSAEISDSDYVISESSDFEYTISEEEREQVREASKFCQDRTFSLRHVSSKKRLQEGESCDQRKRNERKGKEKVADLNIEVVKPVCGICLSEEGKKTVRGTLNCCNHYFCFACIMEWSKVESRCPLCKQRFVTISKPARSTVGFDLRTAVVQVPERDQVYQPSEDELRDYLDPYIDVICTECHQGGDDALMLLCDLCDAPAHTFCVGLGREVPEGNWYCEGCRPTTSLASLDPQVPNLTLNHRGISSEFPGRSAAENVRVAIDLNRAYVPEFPLAEGTAGFNSTPRHHGGSDPPAAASVSSAGVLTVSERRRIQLQINNLLNSRMGHLGGRSIGVSLTTSGINSFGTQAMRQVTEVAFPHSVAQAEALVSHHSFSQGRLQGITTPAFQSGYFFHESSTHSRDSLVASQAYASVDDGFVGGMLQIGVSGISRDATSRLDYDQHCPHSSRSSIADSSSLPHYSYREVSNFR